MNTPRRPWNKRISSRQHHLDQATLGDALARSAEDGAHLRRRVFVDTMLDILEASSSPVETAETPGPPKDFHQLLAVAQAISARDTSVTWDQLPQHRRDRYLEMAEVVLEVLARQGS